MQIEAAFYSLDEFFHCGDKYDKEHGADQQHRARNLGPDTNDEQKSEAPDYDEYDADQAICALRAASVPGIPVFCGCRHDQIPFLASGQYVKIDSNKMAKTAKKYKNVKNRMAESHAFDCIQYCPGGVRNAAGQDPGNTVCSELLT
jgi:hypothetical protein